MTRCMVRLRKTGRHQKQYFEKYLNTVKVQGIKTNLIEDNYSKPENQFGRLFALIRDGIEPSVLLSHNVLKLIKTYLAIQFWRLPMLDEYSDSYVKDLDLGVFGTYSQILERQMTLQLECRMRGFNNDEQVTQHAGNVSTNAEKRSSISARSNFWKAQRSKSAAKKPLIQ